MTKLLLITYYWPPAGGPGVQRWLQMLEFLPDYGFDITVVIPENPAYPIVDQGMLEQLPEGIRVLPLPIREPGQLFKRLAPQKARRMSAGILKEKNPGLLEKALLAIRGNFFIPDARIGWVRPSVKRLIRLIQDESFHQVITTGPPHSVHLIGRALKQKTGMKWVADFRDPWTSIGYHKKLKLYSGARKKHQLLEKAVLNEADKILVTSPGTALEFKSLTERPVHVITNGYSEWRAPETPLSDRFSIAHVGSLLSARNPLVLWDVLAELVEENSEMAKSLELVFAGEVSQDILDQLQMRNLTPFLQLLGYRPYKEIRNLQHSSQVLLLIEIDHEDNRSILPGKLFEYLASQRPILAIGPVEWDAAPILGETGAGQAFEYHQKAEIKAQLVDWFSRFKEKELRLQTKGVEAYSRKNITKTLAHILQWE